MEWPAHLPLVGGGGVSNIITNDYNITNVYIDLV